MCELICRSISDWCSLRDSKCAGHDSQLIACGLSPPLCAHRPRIIHWLHPLEGRYKLNVDATHGHRNAAAGAVLRSSSGYIIGVIVFPLSLTIPLLAELQAAAISLIFFVRHYFAIDM